MRQYEREDKVATARHLRYLQNVAMVVDTVVELGVKRGTSSSALCWCKKRLTSYDIKITPQARKLQQLIGPRWDLREENTLHVRPEDVPEHDVLFIDSLHTYNQVKGELETFAPKTKEAIIFHDTITFATKGADGESGTYLPQPENRADFDQDSHGIRLAIDEFMIATARWVLFRHVPIGHGLLTLRKIR
jgi:hypothetical protein